MNSLEDQAPPADPGDRRRNVLRKAAIVAAAAFVVGYLLAALAMWIGSPGRSVVTVPNFRELPFSEARNVAERNDLVLELADSLPHAEMERGRVLTQSPLPGQEVQPGTPVHVIVSSGRARLTIPQVGGLSQEQALQVLEASGIQAVVQGVHDRRRRGLVVGTDPVAGTVVAIPAQVRLLVSIGPPMVAVPDVLGMRLDSVGPVLDSAGLRLGEVTRQIRFLGLEGEIVSQQPAAGDSVPEGSAVDLTVTTSRLELLSPEEQGLLDDDGEFR